MKDKAQGTGLLGKALPGQAAGATEPMGHMNPGAPRQPVQSMQGAMEEGDESNVSPEEQAEFDQLMNNAYSVIYDKEVTPKLLQSIQSAENPMAALAMNAVQIMGMLEDKALESEHQIDQDIMFHGSVAIVEDIAHFAGVTGAHKFSVQDVEKAWLSAIDMYSEMALQKGTLNEESIMADYEEMIAANEAGSLDEVLPGASEAAEYASKNFGTAEGMNNGGR